MPLMVKVLDESLCSTYSVCSVLATISDSRIIREILTILVVKKLEDDV
jgi:hypothetical protein